MGRRYLNELRVGRIPTGEATYNAEAIEFLTFDELFNRTVVIEPVPNELEAAEQPDQATIN
jgi:hypothetical protein